MVLVDSHVHMYDCFDLDLFLDNAFQNFENQTRKQGGNDDFIGVLCLADTTVSFQFKDLLTESFIQKYFKTWQFFQTDENVSLIARSGNDKSLIIISGQQIVTKENLELLAIGTEKPFPRDIALKALVGKVALSGSIPIIPWGFGKWTGSRGQIIDRLFEADMDDLFFVGDNGGRPNIISFPHHFSIAQSKNIRVLPGSDPLPFKRECKKPGSFGFTMEGQLEPSLPFETLKKKMYDPLFSFKAYGNNESSHYFILNQIKMQIRKRIFKK